MTKRKPMIDMNGEVGELKDAFFAQAKRGRPVMPSHGPQAADESDD